MKIFTIKVRTFWRLIHIIKIKFESLRLDCVELDSPQFNLALSFKLDRLLTTCDSTRSKKHVSYTSYSMSAKIGLVATCRLQTCSKPCVLNFNWTTCNRPVVKLSQAMPTHPESAY